MSSVLSVDRLPSGAPDGAAVGWSAHVVLPDGQVLTHAVAQFDTTHHTATLDAPLRLDPVVGAMAVFSSATAESRLWRVLSVRETDTLGLEFQARALRPGPLRGGGNGA